MISTAIIARQSWSRYGQIHFFKHKPPSGSSPIHHFGKQQQQQQQQRRSFQTTTLIPKRVVVNRQKSKSIHHSSSSSSYCSRPPPSSLTFPTTSFVLGFSAFDIIHSQFNKTTTTIINSTSCSQEETHSSIAIHSDDNDNDSPSFMKRIQQKVLRAFRMVSRSIQLFFLLGPLTALYPIAKILDFLELGKILSTWLYANDKMTKEGESDDNDEVSGMLWYFKLCLWCAESSGAAVIKLMQWASSRPDLFGKDFCAIFRQLQDSTKPHSWQHTEEILENAYGKAWKERIELGDLIGSGCIGQVYKGIVTDAQGIRKRVAVKVMHPDMRGNIDADLDLLRTIASTIANLPFGIGSQLQWLDLPGIVEEFSGLLTNQLDLRVEAHNLRRFRFNFQRDDHVVFPDLVDGFEPKENILVETFCDGRPFMEWLKQHVDDTELRTALCHIGIRTICRMIFEHNFLHGDLHPGNVFVSGQTKEDVKFILLDTGIASEYDSDDHERVIQILANFVYMNGEAAGNLLIDDADARTTTTEDGILDRKAYVAKIKAITDKARQGESLMQHLSMYISYIMDAAVKHHVLLNSAFVSLALAVKVLEGIAIALDPEVEIWRVASPIILENEAKRNAVKLKERFGFIHGEKKNNSSSM